MSPSQVFGISINPISTKGQIMPTTLLCAPTGFSDFPTALNFVICDQSPDMNLYKKYVPMICALSDSLNS